MDIAVGCGDVKDRFLCADVESKMIRWGSCGGREMTRSLFCMVAKRTRMIADGGVSKREVAAKGGVAAWWGNSSRRMDRDSATAQQNASGLRTNNHVEHLDSLNRAQCTGNGNPHSHQNRDAQWQDGEPSFHRRALPHCSVDTTDITGAKWPSMLSILSLYDAEELAGTHMCVVGFRGTGTCHIDGPNTNNRRHTKSLIYIIDITPCNK
jgi:hypothetical protein